MASEPAGRYSGKVVLVTGGAGGLGQATCAAFADEGAAVAVADQDADRAEAVAASLRERGAEATAITVDVAELPSAEAAVEAVTSELGGLDVLVNAAGGSLRRRTRLHDAEAWEYELVVAVNLSGTFYMCKAAAPSIAARGGGSIVNVASMAGRSSGLVAGASYGGAKAGVIGMTRHMAKELGEHNIRVNAIAPGFFPSGERVQALRDAMSEAEWSDLFDRIVLRRLPDVSEVVKPILFLAGDDASFITGVVLDINGGAYMGG